MSPNSKGNHDDCQHDCRNRSQRRKHGSTGVEPDCRVSTYGVKDSQIITVIEGEDANSVNATVQRIAHLERIVGIYPVFAGNHA